MSTDTNDSDTEMTSAETITIGETAAGDPYDLPVEEVLTGRAFATGKSGAGKSNTGSVIAEELLDRGHPLLVVDVDGEYWGLKEAYEVLHVGATDECDLQVGPEHAGKLAELALDQHVPIILDVSGYVDGTTGDELVRETARELFAREQQAMQPFLMLVEEIHEYIPEGGGLDETGEMLIRVAKRGRKRGLGIMGLSQRPADVKKDFITQADLLVWHRLTWDNDTDVVGRVVGSDYANRVSDLGDGEAFVQADWSDQEVERVQVRRKHTFDAGATPGLDDIDRPELKSIGEDLADELDEISTQHERERNRVDELEAKLEEKDERIEELEQELENKEDIADAAQQMAAALQRGAGDDASVDDVPADWEAKLEAKNDQIHELQEDLASVREERDQLEERVDELAAEADRLESYRERVEQAEEIEQRWEAVEDWFAAAPPGLRETAADDEAFVDQPESGEGAPEDLREELAEKEARIDELEARLADAGEPAVPTDYEEFLEDGVVQEQIQDAKENSTASEKYVRAVVAAVRDHGGAVTYDEVTEMPDATDKTHVGRAANALDERRVATIDEDESGKTVDLNPSGIEAVKRERQRRDRRREIMDEL